MYSPDRWIPLLNQSFMLLTAILVFGLGLRHFDDRVAWVALISFVATELVWHYQPDRSFDQLVDVPRHRVLIFCALEICCGRARPVLKAPKSLSPRPGFGPSLGSAPRRGLPDPVVIFSACSCRCSILLSRMPRAVYSSFFRRPDRHRRGLPLVLAHVQGLRKPLRLHHDR
jgi:hypothetical protein